MINNGEQHRMKKNKEETAETIQKLVEIARVHFTEFGYAGAALESIVQEANLTRGAVYHHFRNKKALFCFVLEEVQKEVAEKVEEAASKTDDLWQQLFDGCQAFIMAAIELRSKRIMLLDGPAILGWEAWREMDKNHSMRLLRGQLGIMQDQGCIRSISLDVITHFISGGLNELALWLANESSESNALVEISRLLHIFLDGFKQSSKI